jgi:acetyl-CoA synthetase
VSCRFPGKHLTGVQSDGTICTFVSLKAGVEDSGGLVDELKAHLAKTIDAITRPDEILFAAEFPKTRSGKIVRRLLRNIADGRYNDFG